MADKIKCPNCGETNPAEFEFCQYCQARLQPLTGPLKGADAPIQPGSAPTKKSTADLEPVLPQWLRDARNSARDATETQSDFSQTPQPPTPTPPKSSAPPPQDFLAGLRSQMEDEEDETPDWLVNIAGVEPSPKKPKDGSSDVRWVELGGAKEPAPDEETEMPSWMQDLAPLEPQAGKQDDLTGWTGGTSAVQPPAAEAHDWLHQMSVDDNGALFDESASAFDAPAAPSDTPDWLKSLDAAHSTYREDDSSSSSAMAESPDWLNSLGAQSDAAPASSQAPDWLHSLDATPAQSSETPDWLKPAASSGSSDADTPDWLRSLDSQSNAAASQPSDTPDWLRSLDSSGSEAQDDTGMFGNVAAEAPDWSKSLGAQDSAPAQSFDTSDWLGSLGAADSGAQSGQAAFGTPPASDTPDWLSSLGGADSGAQSAQSAFETPPASDTPDWLSSLGGADSGAQSSQSAFETPPASDTPDWLSSLGAAGAGVQSGQAAFETPPASDTPDWLSSLGGADSSAQSAQAVFETPPSSVDTPDWLSSLGAADSSAQKSESVFASATPAAEPETPDWLQGSSSTSSSSLPPAEPKEEETPFGDVPSWLRAAAPQSSIFDELPASKTTPPAETTDASWKDTFKALEPVAPVQSSSPAFTTDSSLAGDEPLFTEMPDWLANSVQTPAATETPASETPAASELEASQLPAWVQAMRPVDTGVAQISAAAGSEQTLESRGALAGLQGVLPAAPSYAPTSKPKVYSLKLQATDEQVSQAALLEQILAAETSPVPIASFATLRSSRALRWSIAVIFFLMAFAVLGMGLQIFSLPVNVPYEIDGALKIAQSVPANAPVLVAFDYEPARAGEMDAVAAPIFAQLQQPRLAFIATNENSAILAEHFASTRLGLAGSQYSNFGYLSGGQIGIRAFAENPRGTMHFDMSQQRSAWDSDQLKNVNSFSQFAALIVVTDNSDAARAWIEQTTFARGSMPVILISSAQSAPMIQPYYDAGQIQGLVSGLRGGATLEQATANYGTARNYWDAYSIGMLIAAVLILGGGMWNLFQGMRERAATREAK